MKSVLSSLALASVLVFSALAPAQSFADEYPTEPNPSLTPGALCDHPNEKRYPEGIDYCKRNVDGSEKAKVMSMYDSRLGYKTRSLPREQFKIDHYIPLCAGGANKFENLWPQHKSVYEITDPLEQVICEKMAQGKLMQKAAIELIRTGKNNLKQVDSILSHVRSL